MKNLSGLFLILAAICCRADFAQALPQFSVESARSCQTCHIAPENWENPELKLRKCSLSCGSCHVNPTGAGMRNEAGRFYGLQTLPARGPRLTETAARPTSPPPPGSPERFAGISPNPRFQIGADVRLMAIGEIGAEEAEGDGAPDDNVAVFPMQTDLHVALRPFNPSRQNEGRLTLLATVGALGSRAEEFNGFTDRVYLKEWMAIYQDLPYQLYVKGGRFLPAFGWRLDDHTAFTRQGQTFDHQRQVTGIEIGLNPNYAYGHLSVYRNTPTGSAPLVDDSGFGTALTAGYRELLWQAGGSLMYESRDDATDVWAGANWSLNLFQADHPWKGGNVAPLIYLGELDVRRTDPVLASMETYTGIVAYHELNYRVSRGLTVAGRYDWIDRNIDLKDDHVSRYVAELRLHPYRGVELIGQYRQLTSPASESESQGLVQLHLWY